MSKNWSKNLSENLSKICQKSVKNLPKNQWRIKSMHEYISITVHVLTVCILQGMRSSDHALGTFPTFFFTFHWVMIWSQQCSFSRGGRKCTRGNSSSRRFSTFNLTASRLKCANSCLTPPSSPQITKYCYQMEHTDFFYSIKKWFYGFYDYCFVNICYNYLFWNFCKKTKKNLKMIK